MINRVFFAIAVFILFWSLPSGASIAKCNLDNCVIVIDAGSTGSRLHLYQWDNNRVKPLFVNRLNPGIAAFSNNLNALPAYLDALFAGLSLNQEIPVYFNATAGMRLSTQAEQKRVYSEVTQWFQHAPFTLVEANTITGKKEGVYAWLAVNSYLAKPAGVMDMGGASVQIVFPIDSSSIHNLEPSDVVRINFNGKPVTLFSHSFLGLGQTEVTHQFLNFRACYPSNYRMPNKREARGDFGACSRAIEPLVNRVHQVRKVLVDRLSRRNDSWYVLGGLSYLAQSVLLPEANFTLTHLKRAVQVQFCQKNWQSLREKDPQNSYLYANCLSAAYYYALITAGYGLDADTPLHLLPESQMSDWTQGLAFAHFNKVFDLSTKS